MRFTKPSKVIGLDIGSHSVKAVQMSKSGGKLRVEEIGYATVDRNQVNIDPIAAHANALREALRTMAVSQSLVVGALPGQTVVIRYPRLRDVPQGQLDQAVEAEASQNIPYDLSEVFLDWSLLEEEDDGDNRQLRMLLVAAKHEVIDSRIQIAEASEIEYSVLTVDSLALADAAEGCDFMRVGESVALINVGASSVSIHFTKDGLSNFIRDVSWGARELIQAIAKARRCDYDEAERILYSVQDELDEENENTSVETAEPRADSVDPNEGLETMDAGDTLTDPLSEGLDSLGSLDEPETSAVDSGVVDLGEEEESMSEVLALPISRLVAEIRRSFDYYEHQLYERPVERVILSGGVAHISLIRDSLIEDLGIEEVEVADPGSGAILVPHDVGGGQFGQYPAQFMVATGLAARGAAQI